jgi:hypothetical protein
MQIRHLCNQTSGVEEGIAEEYKVCLVCVLIHGRKEFGTRVMYTSSFDFRSTSKGILFHECVYVYVESTVWKWQERSETRAAVDESRDERAGTLEEGEAGAIPRKFRTRHFFFFFTVLAFCSQYVRRWQQAGEGGDAYGNVL